MKTHHLTLCSLAALLSLAACGGDKAKDDATATPNAQTAVSPDEYRKTQQAFADSVLQTTKPVGKLVAQLGKGYAIGQPVLRDTIGTLAQSADCYKVGRNTDPYLAGTVSVFVHMTVIGADLIQVQEANWTSKAGDLVNACLNLAMKKWKLDPLASFGKPASYIVQVQFTMDTTARVDTTKAAMKETKDAKATKAAPTKKP
jgi:hypothetical protein